MIGRRIDRARRAAPPLLIGFLLGFAAIAVALAVLGIVVLAVATLPVRFDAGVGAGLRFDPLRLLVVAPVAALAALGIAALVLVAGRRW